MKGLGFSVFGKSVLRTQFVPQVSFRYSEPVARIAWVVPFGSPESPACRRVFSEPLSQGRHDRRSSVLGRVDRSGPRVHPARTVVPREGNNCATLLQDPNDELAAVVLAGRDGDDRHQDQREYAQLAESRDSHEPSIDVGPSNPVVRILSARAGRSVPQAAVIPSVEALRFVGV